MEQQKVDAKDLIEAISRQRDAIAHQLAMTEAVLMAANRELVALRKPSLQVADTAHDPE